MSESAAVSVEVLAEAMYELIAECEGKKNLKAGDITKAMIAKFGEAACSKDDCKKAIRILIDSERCIYSYLGGSYIQLPPKRDPEQAG
jgi:alcohol dehydrogenase class IV